MNTTDTRKESRHWKKFIPEIMEKGVFEIGVERMGSALYRGRTISESRREAFLGWLKERNLYFSERRSSIEIYTFDGLAVKAFSECENVIYNTDTNEVRTERTWCGEGNWEYVNL